MAGAKIDGQNRLRRLTDAVAAALDNGADIDDDTVDRQRRCTVVFHDLPVEQHCQNAHRNVQKERGKPRHRELTEQPEHPGRAHQAQGIAPGKKVSQHHHKGDCRTDGGGKTCAHDAHIKGEYKGVGDVFDSVLLSALLHNMKFRNALQFAVDFTHKSILTQTNAEKKNIDMFQYGIDFEMNLPWIIKTFKSDRT